MVVADINCCTPSVTSATNQIKVIAWLWELPKRFFAILVPFLVLFKHQPVHNFFDHQQFCKSVNTAAICSVLVS